MIIMKTFATPHLDLKKTLEGLNLYKSITDKFDMHTNNANIQAGEAANLLNLYQKTNNQTLLKAIKFHRDIAKYEADEAEKYLVAAEEVANRLNLDESIRQSGMKKLSRHRAPNKKAKTHASRHKGKKAFSKKRFGI